MKIHLYRQYEEQLDLSVNASYALSKRDIGQVFPKALGLYWCMHVPYTIRRRKLLKIRHKGT